MLRVMVVQKQDAVKGLEGEIGSEEEGAVVVMA